MSSTNGSCERVVTGVQRAGGTRSVFPDCPVMVPMTFPSPFSLIRSLVRNRNLIYQLSHRQIAGRYKGSLLGVVWSFINPLLMLLIYTFVFGFVFKSRWRQGSDNYLEFAVVMYAGIVVHAFIAECLTRAPSVIVENPNFVKKVVFPLETLSWVTIATALFHMAVAILVFFCGILLLQGYLPLTVLLLPVVLAPYALLIAGFVWLLSGLGVYVRDLGQVMGIATSLLMFLSPVFYPLESIPEPYRNWYYLNPVTYVLQEFRAVAIWGHGIDWVGWSMYMGVAFVVAWLGLAWFNNVSKGFADVL